MARPSFTATVLERSKSFVLEKIDIVFERSKSLVLKFRRHVRELEASERRG